MPAGEVLKAEDLTVGTEFVETDVGVSTLWKIIELIEVENVLQKVRCQEDRLIMNIGGGRGVEKYESIRGLKRTKTVNIGKFFGYRFEP